MSILAAAVLDRAVLDRLTEGLADRAFVASLAHRFRGLLAERLDRIATALDAGDLDAAMDAALSLKASAATMGAGELAELARLVEDAVRRQDLDHAATAIPALYVAAARCRQALADYLATEDT